VDVNKFCCPEITEARVFARGRSCNCRAFCTCASSNTVALGCSQCKCLKLFALELGHLHVGEGNDVSRPPCPVVSPIARIVAVQRISSLRLIGSSDRVQQKAFELRDDPLHFLLPPLDTAIQLAQTYCFVCIAVQHQWCF
jgi:hypothetical protein